MPSHLEKNNKADRALDQRLLTLSALFEISQTLSSSLNIRSIVENVLRIPMGNLLINRGIVLLKDEVRNEFKVEELKGLPRDIEGKFLKIDDALDRPTFVKDLDQNIDWSIFFKKFNIKLILPLIVNEGIIGLVGFGGKISEKPYQQNEIEFLSSVANIAATAVYNGLSVAEIKKVNINLDKKIQQLHTIFDISQELNITLDQKKIASLMGFAVMGELLVNKYVVFLKDENTMKPLVTKGTSPLLDSDPELIEIEKPVNLNETERFQKYLEIGFALIIPLRLKEETRGVMMLGEKIREAVFTPSDIEFLTTLGNQAMTTLENARLFKETLEKQRMEEDLRIAKNMQQRLLPSSIEQPEGYEIAGVNIPSREVGGDYYDVIKIDTHTYGIVIADVSGKGAGAALLMSNLQAGLHALSDSDLGLADIISRLNKLIYDNTDLEKYITFFYGILNTKTNKFIFCNAGHNPPYLIDKKGNIRELKTGGIILGMMKDASFETESLELKNEDTIVMFTDGITEAMDDVEQEFGEWRLKELIKKNKKKSAELILKEISSDVKNFAGSILQSDDITMVVIKVKK
ncbi:MAG: GAF domain-containing SpoIIE family protein phosphatase [bacterium]